MGLALAAATLLVLTLSGVAMAGSSRLLSPGFTATATGPAVVSKTIDTEKGSCSPDGGPACAAAAVYGPNGFTGSLTFTMTGNVTVWDYMCVSTPGDPTNFTTFGGTYTLTLFDGSTSLGSSTYLVPAGQSCAGLTNWGAGGSGVTFAVPASLTVGYTLSIQGITAGSNAQAAFSDFGSVQNNAVSASNCLCFARSHPVTPPTNFIVPEAPYAVLLPLSAVLVAAAFVVRRPRQVGVVA
jgi:hypothetical protein